MNSHIKRATTISCSIIFLFLTLLCGNVFAQADSEERERIQHINQVRGLDTLLGKKAEDAMMLIKKYELVKVPVNHYPFIKEVLRIDNFSKWSHPSTLYIFIDSLDHIARMNYFFTDIPIQTAKDFEDSMSWAVPEVKYPKRDSGVLYCGNSPEYGMLNEIVTKYWRGYSWHGPSFNRIFWQRNGESAKVKYMIMSEDYFQNGTARDWGGFIHDDVYEPDLSKK